MDDVLGIIEESEPLAATDNGPFEHARTTTRFYFSIPFFFLTLTSQELMEEGLISNALNYDCVKGHFVDCS